MGKAKPYFETSKYHSYCPDFLMEDDRGRVLFCWEKFIGGGGLIFSRIVSRTKDERTELTFEERTVISDYWGVSGLFDCQNYNILPW